MKLFQHLINGQAINANATFSVLNPATEEVIAECPNASTEQVNEAIHSAKQALKVWQKDEGLRRRCLKQAAAALSKHRDEIAKLLTQEQGKPLAKAEAEVAWGISSFEEMAKFEIPVTVLEETPESKVAVYRRPIGVVAVITPWNFPFGIATKMAAPLLLGNTVIVKPSPYTPLTTLLMGEILKDIFPAAVLNIVGGDNAVGSMITEHPDVRMIAFTGSVPTGINIAKVAANDLKRVSLELGGNDPAIVLKDADPKKIAEKVFWGAFSNSGQVCIAIKRLYLPKNLFNPMIDELIQLAKTTKIGNGLDAGIAMGPLNNKMQLDKVKALVADAKQSNAEILVGDEGLEGPGYFYKPTLLTNVTEDIDIVRKEQFGPALPILSYDDEDEVIERANNTMMGLSASVWSDDLDKATHVAAQLQSGNARVNNVFESHALSPFGGFKHSGLGREGGDWSIAAFSEVQTMVIKR